MEKQPKQITRATTEQALPALVVAYLEVLGGTRSPEQLAIWFTDKFYGEMKYRARREHMARQLTGLNNRQDVKLLSAHLACAADDTTEMVAIVQISGKVLAIAACAADYNGRHRVNAIEIVRPTS